MPAFSSFVTSEPEAPPRVFELPPSAFVAVGHEKPTRPMLVGLRRIAEGDLETARSTAAARAMRLHPSLDTADDIFIEAYNQALMMWAIGASLCQPENADEPLWPSQYDIVWKALSPSGAERVYDEIELLKITDSPTAPEASAEQLGQLAGLLGSGELWQDMPTGDKRWIGRMLHAVLERAHRLDVVIDGDEDEA